MKTIAYILGKLFEISVLSLIATGFVYLLCLVFPPKLTLRRVFYAFASGFVLVLILNLIGC